MSRIDDKMFIQKMFFVNNSYRELKKFSEFLHKELCNEQKGF